MLVVDQACALSETSRTEFWAILCQKVRPNFGRTELGQSLIFLHLYDAKIFMLIPQVNDYIKMF